jgi:hypothetical protein
MHRRVFLSSAALTMGALAFPTRAKAAQACGPVVPTQFGPIQRCTAYIDSVTFQQAFQEMNEWNLYQGTTSVVPKRAKITRGFNP